MHQNLVVHRDINPSNILITDTDKAIIADFGLVTQVGPSNYLKNSIAGTLSCQAPEQFEDSKFYDPMKADIFSLGVVLYFMCMRKLEVDNLNMFKAVKQGKQPCLEGYSFFLNCLFKRIINKNPRLRPNINEILEDKAFNYMIKDYPEGMYEGKMKRNMRNGFGKLTFNSDSNQEKHTDMDQSPVKKKYLFHTQSDEYDS